MQSVALEYVDSLTDIKDALDSFNKDLRRYPNLALDLLRHTTYWVYSPNTHLFGPSKFVGFKKMNFSDYEAARRGPRTGNRFDGHATRKAIEKILGFYAENSELSRQLINWGTSLFGSEVFEGVEEAKWRFTSLRDSR